jgi:hypothetical protein
LMRSVGSEGGSVWECSSIAGDPLSSKGSGTNGSKTESLKTERLRHHSRPRPTLSNSVATEWLNSSNFRIGILAEASESLCRLFLRH